MSKESKTFGDMTKQEQCELKTAHLLGLVIEIKDTSKQEWIELPDPLWSMWSSYRIKPDE